MSPPRTVLITGVSGFIGSALARWLLHRGVRVFGLVRPGSVNGWRLAGLSDLEIIEPRGQQASDLAAALADLPIDAVFNLAAYGVSQQDLDVAATLNGNVGFLSNLLHALPRHRRPLVVHCGSCFEYAPAATSVPLDERAPLGPKSLYGAAKASSVLIGHALAARLELPMVALRLFGVYGPREAEERLIPSLMLRLWRQRPLDLTPGRQIRDLLYVDDACAAFWAAATTSFDEPHSTFNVCSAVPVTVREVAELAAHQLGRPADLLRWGARAYRPDESMWLVGCNDRFRAATGWAPSTSLRDGLRATATHMLAPHGLGPMAA